LREGKGVHENGDAKDAAQWLGFASLYDWGRPGSGRQGLRLPFRDRRPGTISRFFWRPGIRRPRIERLMREPACSRALMRMHAGVPAPPTRQLAEAQATLLSLGANRKPQAASRKPGKLVCLEIGCHRRPAPAVRHRRGPPSTERKAMIGPKTDR